MISLKSFVEAIHEAIISASNALMDKHEGLLQRYFEAAPSGAGSQTPDKGALIPKSVLLEYPALSADGKTVTVTHIQVPLITLVPQGMSQIEKATFTAEFELSLVEDQVQLTFPGQRTKGLFRKGNGARRTNGKLEIVISPQESSEGLKLIVEAYEAMLKRQIS